MEKRLNRAKEMAKAIMIDCEAIVEKCDKAKNEDDIYDIESRFEMIMNEAVVICNFSEDDK